MAMTPQQPLAVTLEAQQWEAVLRLLDEAPAPHRLVHPLIYEIQRQCMATTQQLIRGNGLAKPGEAEEVVAS